MNIQHYVDIFSYRISVHRFQSGEAAFVRPVLHYETLKFPLTLKLMKPFEVSQQLLEA